MLSLCLIIHLYAHNIISDVCTKTKAEVGSWIQTDLHHTHLIRGLRIIRGKVISFRFILYFSL